VILHCSFLPCQWHQSVQRDARYFYHPFHRKKRITAINDYSWITCFLDVGLKEIEPTVWSSA